MGGVSRQFASPTGVLGWIAGQVMAAVGRQRSLATLRWLDLIRNDRVLEIGFGAGADLARVARMVDGDVAGIDTSLTMVRLANRRNQPAVRSGRMAIVHSSADERLPFRDATFTKIFSINSFQFWQRPVDTLREVHRILDPGGTVVIAVQPMGSLARQTTPETMAAQITNAVIDAGFAGVDGVVRPMRPRGTAMARGHKPEPEDERGRW